MEPVRKSYGSFWKNEKEKGWEQVPEMGRKVWFLEQK